MNELIRVAAGLQEFCAARRWRFCFIGGLALQRWGEPRETIDVDLTLLTGFGGETAFIEALLDRYAGRIDDAAAFAGANRVLLLRSASGVGIDVALGALPFEESVVARATPFAFPGDAPLRTCSAEDLIVLKAFAARARDWVASRRKAARVFGVRRARAGLGRCRGRHRPTGGRPRLGLHRRAARPAGGAQGLPRDTDRAGAAPGGAGAVTPPSPAGHRADDEQRLRAGRHRVGQRRVGRFVLQVEAAGEKPEVGPPPVRRPPWRRAAR